MTLNNAYTYKVLKSSWGILITIKAGVLKGEEIDRPGIPVADGISLEDSTQGSALSNSEMNMLAAGLRPLAADIAAAVSGTSVKIQVQEVEHNDFDYQEEGLAAAIFGWAIRQFGLTQREIPVTYDGFNKVYVFDLAGL
jgi:hypothetical protein